MKSRERGFTCLVWVAGCSVFLLACAGRHASSSPPARAGGPEYERAFLQNRLAHQQAAIDMARSCVQKAVHDELKQFCSTLSRTEDDESKQLQGWLNQWYGISAQQATRERATEGYRNFLGSVQSSTGANFEEAFLRALRLHHHEGVRESQTCQERASHAELKSLCSQMVGEQEKEIKQMSTWVCGWFRDCTEK